jgi:hypothetical protein
MTFHYNMCRGQPQGSPDNRETPISSQNNKITNELTNCKLHIAQSWPGDRRSPRPRQPQRPIKRSAPAPLGRNSASLEGPGVVPPKLRIARGLDTPSGETPPRSKPSRARGPSGFQPGHPSSRTPPRSRAIRTLGRISASLEGCAPTGGSPLCSGVSRVRCPRHPLP